MKSIPRLLAGAPRWAVMPFTGAGLKVAQGVWVSMGDVSPVCCLRDAEVLSQNWIYEFKRNFIHKEAEVNRNTEGLKSQAQKTD